MQVYPGKDAALQEGTKRQNQLIMGTSTATYDNKLTLNHNFTFAATCVAHIPL